MRTRDLVKLIKNNNYKEFNLEREKSNCKEITFKNIKFKELKIKNFNFRCCNFNECYLINSKFDNCNLFNSKFDKCDLFNSKFDNCNLNNSKFNECNLSGTCVDPNNIPHKITDEFQKDGDYIIGYRTKHSIFGKYDYEEGKTYEAEIFSTSKDPCHPGLYLAPSKYNLLYVLGYYGPYVKVWAKPEDTHKAGNKYRTKKFYKVINI